MPQRRGVEGMELVSAFAPGAHEPGCLQHLEVLRDRLSRKAEPCFIVSLAQSSNSVWPSRSWSSSRIARLAGAASATPAIHDLERPAYPQGLMQDRAPQAPSPGTETEGKP